MPNSKSLTIVLLTLSALVIQPYLPQFTLASTVPDIVNGTTLDVLASTIGGTSVTSPSPITSDMDALSDISRNDILEGALTTGTYYTVLQQLETSFTMESSEEMVAHTALWKALPIQWRWWRIVQLLSAVIGIIGNLLVMAVVFRSRKARTSTDTLIGALAVADFLTSVFLIPSPDVINIPANWRGELYCKVQHTARFMWISVSASVFTLTTISVERFIGITYPFQFREIFTPLRTNLAILMVWFCAILLNSFAFFVFFVDPESQSCIIRFPTANGGVVLGITSYIFVLILPMLIMLVTQSLTVYSLHLESRRFLNPNSVSQATTRLLMARRRVIKLIFIINITFVICWAPNQSAYLAFNLGFLPFSYLYGPLDRALVVLAFFNSCANPIIYTLQHQKFRTAIKEMITSSTTEVTPIFSLHDDSHNSRSKTGDKSKVEAIA